MESRSRAEFAHTLAIYCSDGRFAPACEQFIQQALGEAWYDRFTVPGGAAWLCLDALDLCQFEIARRHISFLVKAHGIQRVILIAHQHCGFYEQRCLSPERIEQKQKADLQAATCLLREEHPCLKIEAYYLRVDKEQPCFERVTLRKPDEPPPLSAPQV
ncbi:MAG: hypothetical protein RMM08_06040 [Armatimonadota bacterium]|nr:hypothetical protein [bacterium]MDW8320905.1 hypothetical protein [Armatimonadota bacterium]